ncbi:MAG TPA: hypothetical protein VIG08_12715 [Gemmatimonadales bacterium]|jgi:hypothetical protein
MPVTYRIDQSERLIHTRCVGPVVLAEVRQHFIDLSQDPACSERLDVLLDLTAMTTLPASDQLRTVTGDIARLRPQIQFGFCAVIASAPALFGMSRMFEVFAEQYFTSVAVFRTEAEGVHWLEAQQR